MRGVLADDFAKSVIQNIDPLDFVISIDGYFDAISVIKMIRVARRDEGILEFAAFEN